MAYSVSHKRAPYTLILSGLLTAGIIILLIVVEFYLLHSHRFLQKEKTREALALAQNLETNILRLNLYIEKRKGKQRNLKKIQKKILPIRDNAQQLIYDSVYFRDGSLIQELYRVQESLAKLTEYPDSAPERKKLFKDILTRLKETRLQLQADASRLEQDTAALTRIVKFLQIVTAALNLCLLYLIFKRVQRLP